jgi:subtilisin family serine protease
MKTFSIAIAALLLSILLPSGAANAAAEYVSGEMIVKFKASATPQVRRAALARQGHAILADLYEPGMALVRVDAGQTVEEAVAAYRSDPDVAYAQPNYVYEGARLPLDPLFGQVWGLNNTGQTITSQPPGSPLSYDVDYPGSNPGTPGDDLDVAAAWTTITDCSNVVVAVLDTGVNYTHEDLAANMWRNDPLYPRFGYDFVNSDPDPVDENGHGTHVAGTIGAVGNNGKGVAGVCWSASIMAVQVLNAASKGSTAGIVGGIGFAVDHGAKVINMSIQGRGPLDQAWADAIGKAKDNDVVVVVCAGNYSVDTDIESVWPCSFGLIHSNVVCVAAIDQKDRFAFFSNYGARTVAVGAPGTNILSAGIGGTDAYALDDGTSMASPAVAGVAALLRAHNPLFRQEDVVTAITEAGRPVPSLAGITRTGMAVDAARALAFIQTPTGLSAKVE